MSLPAVAHYQLAAGEALQSPAVLPLHPAKHAKLANVEIEACLRQSAGAFSGGAAEEVAQPPEKKAVLVPKYA